MSIIDCPECKSKVSDYASSCHGCGYPVIVDRNREREVFKTQREVVGIQKIGKGAIIFGGAAFIITKDLGWVVLSAFGIFSYFLSEFFIKKLIENDVL